MEYSKLPFKTLKEYYERANRFIRINENFRPIVTKDIPLTAKFYSKYENTAVLLKNKRYELFLPLVEHSLLSPAEKYPEPVTESHNYGWLPGPMFKYDCLEQSILHHPKRTDEMFKIGEQLALEKKLGININR